MKWPTFSRRLEIQYTKVADSGSDQDEGHRPEGQQEDFLAYFDYPISGDITSAERAEIQKGFLGVQGVTAKAKVDMGLWTVNVLDILESNHVDVLLTLGYEIFHTGDGIGVQI